MAIKEKMEIILVVREEKQTGFTCVLCRVCFLAAQVWFEDLEGSGVSRALALWKPANNFSLSSINEREWASTRWLFNSFRLNG